MIGRNDTGNAIGAKNGIERIVILFACITILNTKARAFMF